MLGWILERTKMASIAGKWADATSLDPGDRGQTAVMASALMKQSGMRAEDAWLTALCSWMCNHPDQQAGYTIAVAMIRFLDIYEHSVGLSPETREFSRLMADGVVDNYDAASKLIKPAVAPISQPVPPPAPTPAPVSAQKAVQPLTAITKLPESDFLPADVMTKDYAYDRALPILTRLLREDGYMLEKVCNRRVDTPSVIASKGDSVFFILLDAAVYPKTPNPAPFMVQRCVEEARKEKAQVCVARITMFNADAYTEGDKSDIVRGKLGWNFAGLERVS